MVEDYRTGIDESIDNRIYQFQNTLVYEGTNLNGQKAILQYDKQSGQITEIATNEDFDGDILNITSNTEELVILTGEGSIIRNLYTSYESDFSDLQLVHNAGDNDMARFRFYQDHKLIFEEYNDGEEKINIRIVEPNGNIVALFSGLPGSAFDYGFTAIKNHFIIAPEVNLIDGQNIIAYSLDSKSLVPVEDITVEYDENIYYTHIDPEVGSELFWIDYELSSTKEVETDLAIHISPNPVSDILQITDDQYLKPIQSLILDQNGKVVAYNIDNIYHDISGYDPGLYILKTRYDNGKIGVARFVKI